MGDCVTTLQLAQPGAAPLETAHQLIRSGDGKIRVDSGNVSVITDPVAQRTIMLDHVNKLATSVPMQPPPAPEMPPIPGMPQFTPPQIPSNVPAPPAANIQDLGKRIIEGEEAEGKRITLQPPSPPAMPNLPAMPGMPKLPQRPGLPGAPQLPQPPQLSPTVTEMWTNTNLHLPVLTQVKGDFGQQTCKCKNKAIAEPHPSMFEIPAGYKEVKPEAPSLPNLPHK
jgi:hypothetical protein